jgi:biotin carboxylase
MAGVRVLLSDGSGLTSRQVATRLARAGHHVEVLAPDAWCLTRFTSHVRRVHPVPAYGADPMAWLDAALRIAGAGRFDVLFPTQEQVAVLAAQIRRVRAAGVATAVPDFAALRQVQDKLSARQTLARLGLPQPDAFVATSPDEMRRWPRFPVFVKTPIGTATSGVRRVAEPAELDRLAADLAGQDAFGTGVLLQAPAQGPLVMVQSIFASGELVAFHANLRVREGASGGASHKRSVALPAVRDHMARLGGALGWHGALSADAILTADGPCYIDINPRLVEPGNACQAGVDLVGALLAVACEGGAEAQPDGRAGVRTHQLLLAVLGAAQHGGRRRDVLRELADATRGRNDYRDSREELTPLRRDLRTLLPVVAAGLVTLVRPATWRIFSGGAVSGYALSPEGWRTILRETEGAG